MPFHTKKYGHYLPFLSSDLLDFQGIFQQRVVRKVARDKVLDDSNSSVRVLNRLYTMTDTYDMEFHNIPVNQIATRLEAKYYSYP